MRSRGPISTRWLLRPLGKGPRRGPTLVLLLGLALWPGAARAQVTDDFGSATIDVTKWQDASSDRLRRLNAGRLEFAITRFGNSQSSALAFTDPQSVLSMRADVTVASFVGTDLTRARLSGNF
jgi:hypothetical protein